MKKSKKLKKHNKKRSTSERKLKLETIENGVQIGYKVISANDKIDNDQVQTTLTLSDTSIELFERKGRGSFFVAYDYNKSESVYLSSKDLFELITQFLPEALPKVQSVMNDYDPIKEYVLITVSQKRIIISVEAKRFYSDLAKW